jgi:hypothetical protein
LNLIALSLLLGSPFLLTASEHVPNLRIDASCREVTQVNRSTGLADAQSLDGCMRDEEQARETLAPIWATFPAAERERCIGEATTGSASYVDLLTCLQMARDADALEKSSIPRGARKSKVPR